MRERKSERARERVCVCERECVRERARERENERERKREKQRAREKNGASIAGVRIKKQTCEQRYLYSPLD